MAGNVDPKILAQINAAFDAAGLDAPDRKATLRAVIDRNWGKLPPFSTLEKPIIEEVQKVAVGSGVAMTWKQDGVRKVLLGEAGAHYARIKKIAEGEKAYTIPGGFLTLTHTTGSIYVAASEAAETPRNGTAREFEEEFKNKSGGPLLPMDPARLEPLDTTTIDFGKGRDKLLVMSFMVEANADEIQQINTHVARLANDPDYRTRVEVGTVNEHTGMPEIATLKIFDLQDVADGKVNLMQKDQLSLFKVLADRFARLDTVPARQGPTPSSRQKIKTPSQLEEAVAEFRARTPERAPIIGFTSGTFDIYHVGHNSFLEDAKAHCDFLIVAIASDRTTRQQKGDEKPYIPEQKRAAVIASVGCVDAVIVSDEDYHESILAPIAPDIMFKGDEYTGKHLIGSELVGKVVIIQCAEDEFFHSSELAKRIKAGSVAAWRPTPQ